MIYALRFLSGALCIIPTLVLIGWVIDNEYLKRIYPSFVEMNPLVALTFIAISTLIFLQTIPFKKQKYFDFEVFLKFCIFVFPVIVLLRFITPFDSHLDQILFRNDLGSNRMAPNTAICLSIIGFVFIVRGIKLKFVAIICELLTIIILLISLQVLLGYVYNLSFLYRVSTFIPMAIHTATCVLITAISLVLLNTNFHIHRQIANIFSRSMQQKMYMFLLSGLAILLITSFVTYLSIQRVLQSDALLARYTHEELVRAQVLQLLTDAETGQRGYIITGETKYLRRYYIAISELPKRIKELKEVSTDNAYDAHIERLDVNITKKLNELTITIQTRREQGFGQTQQIVSSDEGKFFMDNIRDSIAIMNKIGDTKISEVQGTKNNSIRYMLATLLIGAFAAIGIVFAAIVIVTRDIKKKNEYEQKLLEAKAKDEAILSGIGDGVFAIDKQGNIILFNPVAERITGFPVSEAIGKHYKKILRFAKRSSVNGNNASDDVDDFINLALSGQMSEMSKDVVIINKNDQEIPVADSAAPFKDSSGNVIGAVIVFRDVTEERAIDQAKSEFVSLASHQLRTPLSAINWYTEMLLAGDAGKISEDQKKYLEEVYAANKRMVELVNSLLNVSRLELGTFTIEPTDVDLNGIITSVVTEVKSQIELKNQKFTTNIDKDIDKYQGDEKLIRIIVQNLLTNAIKYTPEKGIINLSLLKKENFIRLTVEDSGLGIPTAQQKKIFSKLFRADNVRATETEGTGLGLYIVKAILDEVGGEITFVSKEMQGTKFTVDLPKSGMKKKQGSKQLDL